jgi:hypothetical protein
MKTQLSTMECALAGLFDYAGMFPPAEVDLSTALHNFREYRRGMQRWALGSLVVEAPVLGKLQKEPHDLMRDLHLSALTTQANLETVQKHLAMGLPIGMIEVKARSCNEILRWKETLPPQVPAYIEIPTGLEDPDTLDAIAKAGMRAKIRMGGVVADAFPASPRVAATLKRLAVRRLAFKATAGLHHALRSRHVFTYRHDSESGVMHGFMNLLCASAIVWFGGDEDEATQVLEEQDLQSWQVTPDSILWRSRSWSQDQLREARKNFLISIGSCSFTEPMADLEALGWL